MAKKKAEPIADLNGDQWHKVEKLVCSAIIGGEPDDSKVALDAMNTLFGKIVEGERKSPPRGYSSDLMDGVRRMAEVRRKQLKDYQ